MMTQIAYDHPFCVGIDLGSNTLRIIALTCDTHEILYSHEVIVRSADGLAEHHRISIASTERIIDALYKLLAPLKYIPDSFRAVATEALRRADNAEEVLEQIRQQTGVQFEIIDADEEARLTLLAVEKRLDSLGLDPERFALVDIGGGSTELTLKCAHKIYTQSFPLGIVTLTQEADNRTDIDTLLSEKLVPVKTFWHTVLAECGEIDLFIATAGTPTTIAAMKLGMQYETYDSTRINGTRLYRKDLALTLEKLLKMSSKEREKAVGVGREDLIVAGIKIFDAIYALLGQECALVIDDGLREGVVLELCSLLV